MKHITLSNFEEEVKLSKLPVVLDFYASWCGPCQMMGPIFEKISKVYDKKINFAKVDTQDDEGLSFEFGVQGIPTLVFISEGKEIMRVVGYLNENSLKEKLEEFLKKLKKK